MIFRHVRVISLLVLAAWTAAPPISAQPRPTVVQLLDRYLSGAYEEVLAVLETRASDKELDEVLKGFERDAPGWIVGAGPEGRDRRVLAAATLALEAGRVGAFSEWKWVQFFRQTFRDPTLSTTYYSIYWKAPPQLIEWGCQLLRTHPQAESVERTWHLAAMAAAQRAADFEFVIGSPFDVRDNPKDEIEHLKHSRARFPDEPRFILGQAIAIEWTTYPATRVAAATPRSRDAIQAYEELEDDEVVGPEAMTRLTSVLLRAGRLDDAVRKARMVEYRTRDPFLVYLASYFAAQAHQRAGRIGEAEIAYRRALAAVPGAQSAAFELGALLQRVDRVSDAAREVEAAFANPLSIDPWREYGRADDRFWPELITRLRQAINP